MLKVPHPHIEWSQPPVPCFAIMGSCSNTTSGFARCRSCTVRYYSTVYSLLPLSFTVLGKEGRSKGAREPKAHTVHDGIVCLLAQSLLGHSFDTKILVESHGCSYRKTCSRISKGLFL
jgi:hypothetical protein